MSAALRVCDLEAVEDEMLNLEGLTGFMGEVYIFSPSCRFVFFCLPCLVQVSGLACFSGQGVWVKDLLL